MNPPFKEIKNKKSMIIFILCLAILVIIPVYWFFFVPPALELQEIHQNSVTATGYFAPGGYFNLSIDTGSESIHGFHFGEYNIVANLTNNPQTAGIWKPISNGVDQWPGSKEEIKYSTNQPINEKMYLNIERVDIPRQTELEGKTIPLTVKYYINYPYQTSSTNILGGSITNFAEKSETIEKTINIKLDNKMISQSEMNSISMNEGWKKIASLIIWISTLLILIFFYSNFKLTQTFRTKFKSSLEKFLKKIEF